MRNRISFFMKQKMPVHDRHFSMVHMNEGLSFLLFYIRVSFYYIYNIIP